MNYPLLLSGVVSASVLIFIGCGGGGSSSSSSSETTASTLEIPSYDGPDLTSRLVNNEFAYIPPQCYTKTDTGTGQVHNPCYSCHTKGHRPNYIDDSELQEAYDFRTAATIVNNWTNLFVDRTAAVSAISDTDMQTYIDQDNYQNTDNQLILRERLLDLPKEWDANDNGQWDGYVPDCYFNFDSEGFDKAPDGSYTLWRAFAYQPFLGTFWPTNGSTDDVLIRLPEEYAQDVNGDFSLEVYKINLAVVEAVIKEQDIVIDPVDESQYGIDLDKDGSLRTASVIKYDWAPLEGKTMSYVGQVVQYIESGGIEVSAGFYPKGTELLHSVRYIGVHGEKVGIGTRMKELRYAKKHAWMNYPQAKLFANDLDTEVLEDDVTGRQPNGDMEEGLNAGNGWTYQGFIEDTNGNLRPQTYEENLFCIGCHTTIGAITDSTFAFPRKFDHTYPQQGWYHWTQHGLENLRDRVLDSGEGEFATYLRKNHAGDEFRENFEVMDKFFNADGSEKSEAFEKLQNDISYLLLPSKERAMNLDKAYWTIVKEQSFVKGRDATITPVVNVHDGVEKGQLTGLEIFVP